MTERKRRSESGDVGFISVDLRGIMIPIGREREREIRGKGAVMKSIVGVTVVSCNVVVVRANNSRPLNLIRLSQVVLRLLRSRFSDRKDNERLLRLKGGRCNSQTLKM